MARYRHAVVKQPEESVLWFVPRAAKKKTKHHVPSVAVNGSCTIFAVFRFLTYISTRESFAIKQVLFLLQRDNLYHFPYKKPHRLNRTVKSG